MMSRPGDDDTANDVDPSERSRNSRQHQLKFSFFTELPAFYLWDVRDEGGSRTEKTTG